MQIRVRNIYHSMTSSCVGILYSAIYFPLTHHPHSNPTTSTITDQLTHWNGITPSLLPTFPENSIQNHRNPLSLLVNKPSILLNTHSESIQPYQQNSNCISCNKSTDLLRGRRGRPYLEQTSADPEHLQNKSDARDYRPLTAT